MLKPLPQDDLVEIAERSRAAFDALKGKHIAITGASGFVGSWMVASGRNQGFAMTAFRGRRDGDIRSIALPEGVTHVIHCASAGSATENVANPNDVCDMIFSGTRRVVEECERVGVQRLLLLSSGSVYDKTPSGIYAEDCPLIPTIASAKTPVEFFALAKRLADEFVLKSTIPAVIARGFAMLGARLPGQFAATEFMRMAKWGEPIRVRNPGTLRSYLYASDMAAWLWNLLVFGEAGTAYNVGGPTPVRMDTLAMAIEKVSGVPCVYENEPPNAPFIADISRSVIQGWGPRLSLEEAIARWWAWEQPEKPYVDSELGHTVYP